MNKPFLSVLLLFHIVLIAFPQTPYDKQWPQFRGPFASGIVETAGIPDHWDIDTGENIRWKAEIPGLGHSCPVIWDEKVFVTTAISGSGTDSLKVGLYGDIDDVKDNSVHKFMVYCFDKNTGKEIWSRTAHEGIPKTRRHTKSSHANSTPATDGNYMAVFFGSEGLYCYDLDGNLKWEKDFGIMNAGPYTDPEAEWGFASSPIIHEGRVIVQCDFLGDSFIASLDAETGEELWRAHRDEISTWGTPNFYNGNGYRQIVVNGWKHMGAYDFDTGEEIWWLSGGGDAPIPTPIFHDNLIYIHNAHGRWSPIFAIKPDSRGDITLHRDSTFSDNIVWSIKRGGAYNPTNIIYGDYMYNMRMNGYLTSMNAKTGELIYRQRLLGANAITASAVASDGKIYYSSEQGVIFIIKAGKEFEVIATNPMKDIIMATPAISDGTMFVRTQHWLVAVGG